MKSLLFAFIFILFTGHLAAQKKTESLTRQVDLLIKKAVTEDSLRNFEAAIKHATAAVALSEKSGNRKGLVEAYSIRGTIYADMDRNVEAINQYLSSISIAKEINEMDLYAWNCGKAGVSYRNLGNFSQALHYDSIAYQWAEKTGNDELMNFCLRNIGIVYRDQGNADKALEYYIKALRISERMGRKNDLTLDYGNIGLAFSDKKIYDKALHYDTLALNMAEQTGDREAIARTLGNIGVLYYKQNDYANALDYYTKALTIDVEINNNKGKQLHLGNIGLAYADQKQYERALEYYIQSKQISETLDDKSNISITLGNIGEIYLNQNRLEVAESTFNQALGMFIELDDLIGIKDMYYYLSKLHEKKGNPETALSYFKKYSQLNDSLFNEENMKKSLDAEANYQNDKKEAIDNKERERQKAILWSVGLGSGGVLLILILVFLLYRNNRKRSEIALKHQVSDTEMKALRSQMNPHFIFNALQSIQTFLMSNKSEDANTYLLKFSKLMRLVLENSQYSEVPLESDIQALDLYMQLERIRLAHPFTYKFHIDDSIDVETTTIPPLILQPFVENAIWHGLQHKSEPGRIDIYIRKDGNVLYAIVEDNGVGRSMSQTVSRPTPIKKQSLGMKLTEDRLKILNELKKMEADFKVTDLLTPDNKPAGTKVELTLPST